MSGAGHAPLPPIAGGGDDLIVVLTGAGISAESGLKTFRGRDGLWYGHRIEDVATPDGFNKDPERVQRFYNERRRQLNDPKLVPNEAHRALARLEKGWPGEVLVITQNIDDLHERAGTENLVHMHGSLLSARCTNTKQPFRWEEDITMSTPCPCCGVPGSLRPHVVWFGETPMELPSIYGALHRCSLFVAIGTSGVVFPAAGFVEEVNAVSGAPTVELNLEPSDTQSAFSIRRYGPASVIVPGFVDELLAQRSKTDR